MPRVTYEEVLEVLENAIDEDTIEAAIVTANVWIDARLASVCTVLSNAELIAIEKHLSAHLSVLGAEGMEMISSTRADVAEKYAEMAKGQTTRHIGIAAAFDPCGIIKEAWMDRARVRFKVGTTYQAEA
jgi:hypothetical protein